MLSLRHDELEICFSDRGRLLGITQDGEPVSYGTGKDYLLQIVIDGKPYDDAGDFVFIKAEKKGEEELVLSYELPGLLSIALHLTAGEYAVGFRAVLDTLSDSGCAAANAPEERSGAEIQSVTYQIPAIRYDSVDKDWFHAPGQGACFELTSGNVNFGPDVSVREMAQFVTEEDMYSTTPDKGAGLLVVERGERTAAVGFTSYCARENFYPMTEVREDGICLRQRNMLVYDRKRFPHMEAGTAYLLTGGSYEAILVRYQKLLQQVWGVKALKAPEWLHRGAILETSMLQLSDFTKALEMIDEIYSVGIRTIYLMPCMKYKRPSMYCTVDYYQIDPAFGGDEAFRRFVSALHEKGMKILMDLVPQGTSADSRLVEEHPEWFEKDPAGNMFASHGWDDTRSLDWANPGAQQFFIDVACFYIREFGVDGYRIDAPHWKEPNRDKGLPYHASNTCFGSVRLLEGLLRQASEEKEDIALLCEVWGAIFEPFTHAACEYNIHWALYNTATGVFRGNELQRWLSCYRYTQPEGASKVVFLETHDTALLTPVAAKLRGSQVTEALIALSVFAGCDLMIWYEELRVRKAFYEKLLTLKEELAEELRGWPDLDAVHCSNQDIFAASRTGERKLLYLANFGRYPARVRLEVPKDYFGLEPERSYRLANLFPVERNILFPDGMECLDGAFTGGELGNTELLLKPCSVYWLEIKEQ